MVKSLGKRIARKTPAGSSVALAPVVGYITTAPVGCAAPALLWIALRLRQLCTQHLHKSLSSCPVRQRCTLHLHLPMGTFRLRQQCTQHQLTLRPTLLLCQLWRVSRKQCPALLLRRTRQLHNISVSRQRLPMHTSRSPGAPRVKIRDEGPCPSGMRHRPSVAGKCDTRAARAVAARLGYMWRKSKQVERPPVIGILLTWVLCYRKGTSWPRLDLC